MSDAHLPPAGGAQPAPTRKLPSNAASSRALTVRELADAYMASYRGRDPGLLELTQPFGIQFEKTSPGAKPTDEQSVG